MDISRYAELFRAEAREHLANIEQALQQFAIDASPASVDELFRSTHTIKGMAGAMGYASVEQLAHALESVLEEVRRGSRQSDRQLQQLLVDGSDALAGAIDAVVNQRNGDASAGDAAAVQARGFAELDERRSGDERRASTAMRTVRIDLQRLDALLDLAGELALTRDRLLRELETSSVSHGGAREHDSGLRRVRAVAQETATLVTALQEEVVRLRLVPARQIFDRYPRLVRDAARELNKDVALAIEGRDIELDRSLLEALGEPIIHLLRNAADHGIEHAEQRIARGKPVQGQLVLRAMRDRGSVVIQVEDDGGGIDRTALLVAAKQRELVPATTERLDDEQLLRIIAQPGISTASSVSRMSGRGVGVDVVITRIRALGGTVELESEEGRGTRFTLRLPASLANMRALLVSAGGEQYALPAAHVMDVHEWETVGAGKESADTVPIRDMDLPLVRLQQRFGNYAESAEERHVVVYDTGSGRRALLVDSIVGHQEIVVRTFHNVADALPFFTGATLLGDGTPALIVDLGSL